jgi:hypothetical protein
MPEAHGFAVDFDVCSIAAVAQHFDGSVSYGG